MAAILAVAVCQENSKVPRNRFLPKRFEYFFNLDDSIFIENFRLNKELAQQLIEEIRPQLEPRTIKKNAISVEGKVSVISFIFIFFA